MLEQIVSLNLFAFLLIFVRVGTAFFLFPGFSSQQVSMRLRLTISVAISFLLTPVLMDVLPKYPDSPWTLACLLYTSDAADE